VESASKIYGVNNRKTIDPHSETVQYSSPTNVETDENTKQESMLIVGIGHQQKSIVHKIKQINESKG